MKNKCAIFLISLNFFVCSSLMGDEKQSIANKADNTIESFNVLSGWSSISFYMLVPVDLLNLSYAKKNDIAVLELGKWGQVVQKALPVLDPFEGGKSLSVLFTNPSLTYEIEEMKDIEGIALPIVKATLKFEAGTTVNHNKVYDRFPLWTQTRYIRSNGVHQPEVIFSKTLSILLSEFQFEYARANQDTSIKPVIYVITP